MIDYLLTECNQLQYPEMRISCDKFVNDSGQLVVDLILQDLTPQVICKFGGTRAEPSTLAIFIYKDLVCADSLDS